MNFDNIKLELLKSKATDKEIERLYDNEGNLIEDRVKYYCRKHKINYYKINKIQKEYLQTALNNKQLKNMMMYEKPLNIVLDNARIHTAKIVEEACDILSVNLVFLPPYCPFLSPIEDVWKDVKREIYNSNYDSLDELTNLFKIKFEEKVDSKSYFENWVMKFFGQNIQ